MQVSSPAYSKLNWSRSSAINNNLYGDFCIKTTICLKCNNHIKNCNYNRHYNSCNGNGPNYRLTECPYCYISVDYLKSQNINIANHVRWCDNNPNRESYITTFKNINSYITPDIRKLISDKIKLAWEDGKYNNVMRIGFKDRTHTHESKEKIRIKALNSKHRRLRKNPQFYNGILMDSSWEVELAKRLDDLNIKWIRPDPIVWTDLNNLTHNYFPDFYLTDYDIYLDPKNPFAYQQQIEKIKILLETYSNIIFITSINDIKTFNIGPII